MPRSKSYKATASAATQAAVEKGEVNWNRPLTLNYAEASGGRRNPTSTRWLDMKKWTGTPQEFWAKAWLYTLDYVLRKGEIAVATCVKLGNVHSAFFQFLSDLRLSKPPAGPAELKARHLALFRQWLSATYIVNTANNYHTHVKIMVVAMMELGLVDGYVDQFFPRNALKRGNDAGRSAVALSEAELQRLVQALKRDLIDLHKGAFLRSSGAAITVYFLVLAMRTGGNPTPLLELNRQSLKPHIVPGMMRLDLVKYRGFKTYATGVRDSKKSAEPIISVPMDGVAIINRVLETTEPFIELADPDNRDRLWLFESTKGAGEILCLSQAHVDKTIPSFVRRHDLRGDDGEPLVLNLSRLRKNKAQQLFKLSGGDLATVALLLGNTPAVAGKSYLSMTANVKAEGAAFVGEVLEASLAGKLSDDGSPGVEATPVGRCKDTLNGAFAPKNGSHCDEFTHCLSCPSFAIAATVPDLHRLFSFQEFLRAEIAYYPEGDEYDEWRAHRGRLIALIDDFTKKRFKSGLVADARALTSNSMHKFWSIQLHGLQRRRGDYE